MKTGILLWLAFSIVTTASKWAASGRIRTTLTACVAMTTLTWFLTDRISEVSDREIQGLFDLVLVRDSILGIVTIESVCVGLYLWKSMRNGRSGFAGRAFDVLTVVPSLGFFPAIILAVHEVISKWNSVDFGTASILTSAAACWSAWILSITMRRILREDSTRIELAALVTISFLPWTAVVMGWVRFSSGGYTSTRLAFAPVEATPTFWAMSIGLPTFGFVIRQLLNNLHERRLG
jgi:hypothetical protein